MTGTDSVIDHWSPYGLGDMLEKPISTPSSISAPTNRPFRVRWQLPPATYCRSTIKASASGRKSRMRPALCWSMPPVPPKRWHAFHRVARPSTKARWCGAASAPEHEIIPGKAALSPGGATLARAYRPNVVGRPNAIGKPNTVGRLNAGNRPNVVGRTNTVSRPGKAQCFRPAALRLHGPTGRMWSVGQMRSVSRIRSVG